MLLKPTIYQKSIYDISYEKLKKKKIRALIFDLDNTVARIDQDHCPEKSKALISKLKKDFDVFLLSNNTKRRVEPYRNECEVEAVCNALKPSSRGLKKIMKKGYSKNEMILIGDQLVTDILAGKLFSIPTILVDPLGEKDLKITKLNRFIEKKILKKYKKKNILERGKYYE